MSGYEISIKEGISLFTSVRSYITLFEEMSVTIKCNDCQFNSIFHKKNNFWLTGANDPSIGHMLIIHCLDMNQSMGNYDCFDFSTVGMGKSGSSKRKEVLF